MNILLINHYAGSPYYGMEFRPYYLAREWVKLGHHVTIIAASFSHLRQHNLEVVKDFQEDIEGIKYVWLKTPKYGGSIKRVINILVFLLKLNKYKKKIVKSFKPDLVIASSTYPFDNYLAYGIAKFAGAKYCYEIHDIWPLGPIIVGGYSKWNPFIIMMQFAEDFAYKHVDKVISLLWNAECHCIERGLKPNKFACIPNGYNPEEWTEESFKQPLPYEHRIVFDNLKGKTIVGFAGGFAASGAVITLVKAAVILSKREDIHFVIVGKGPEKINYEKIIKENRLENVTLLPPVQKILIPVINSYFDIAYLGGVHSELHKYGTSYNKMTDYMLCSKPIVQAVDEPGSAVERYGCGIRVDAENDEKVAEAIMRIVEMKPEERTEMGMKGRKYAETLNWSTLADRFISEFK